MSSHGTRVIQKLLDIIPQSKILIQKITFAINNNLLDITMDANSNHIIQKYVTVVRYPLNSIIYDNIVRNFLVIARDKFGCCMMQKCVECGTEEQKEVLFMLSLKYSPILIVDQYGNYVLQYIARTGNQKCISSLVTLIITNIQSFCCQKFSSNVIEKCIESSSPEIQTFLINSIIKNEKLISALLIDSYGNYIIQKILMVTKGKTYHYILNQIAINEERIRRVSFGNRILAKLMSLHKDLCFMLNKPPSIMNYNINNEYNGNVNFHNSNNYSYLNRSIAHSNMNQYK